MDIFIDPFFYNWLIFGAIFLIIEVASFTLLFLWLAFSAVILAGISYLFPDLSLTIQLWIFSVISILSVIIWHQIFRKKQEAIGDKKMNNRAERYIGRTATLSEAISNGYGKIQIEDSFWKVTCETDLPQGTKVEITDADGVILTVRVK